MATGSRLSATTATSLKAFGENRGYPDSTLPPDPYYAGPLRRT